MNYTFTVGGSEEGGEVSMMLVMAKQRQILPRKKLLVKPMYTFIAFSSSLVQYIYFKKLLLVLAYLSLKSLFSIFKKYSTSYTTPA